MVIIKKVKISADSTCDLSKELIEKYDISIIPLYINMEGKSLLDGIEVSPDDIFESVSKTNKIPKTSAPNYSDYEKFFTDLTKDGSEVVHISINSAFSSSYANAKTTAADFDGIYVVDSLSLSTAMGLLVILAAELAQEGYTAAQIAAEIELQKQKLNNSFLLSTLDYAHKGGRCSALMVLGANLLKLKPRLLIDKMGNLKVDKKYRGSLANVAIDYVKDILSEKALNTKRAFVSHTGVPKEIIDNILKVVKEIANFKEVIVTRCGCTITCHGGPGTLAVFFLTA